MTTFNQVKELILAQGIVSRVNILPETDIVLDLNYKPTDVAELFHMIHRLFNVQFNLEEITHYTRLDQITHYIRVNRQLLDFR